MVTALVSYLGVLANFETKVGDHFGNLGIAISSRHPRFLELERVRDGLADSEHTNKMLVALRLQGDRARAFERLAVDEDRPGRGRPDQVAGVSRQGLEQH